MLEHSKESRKAHYEFLTGLAYKLNDDRDRMSAIRIRDLFMKATLGKDNVLDTDRIPKPKTMGTFLPDALKDDKVS